MNAPLRLVGARRPGARWLATAITLASSGFAPCAVADEFAPSPLQRGIWKQSPPSFVAEAPGAPAFTAASTNVWHLPGFVFPAAMTLEGDDLYVTNHQGSDLVTVVDVQTFGAEVISQTIATPVDPIDLVVAGSELWVVGPARNALHHRPIAGGVWNSIALPAAFPEWSYGHVVTAHPDGVRLFVAQLWENRIQVVDRTAGVVIQTISDLHHLPEQVLFFAGGTRMAVLSVGLDAPHCQAIGPHVAVYAVSGPATRLFEFDVSGECPLSIAEDSGTLFVTRDGGIAAYDAANGQLLASGGASTLGRYSIVAEGELVTQSVGTIIKAPLDLSSQAACDSLLQNPLTASPALGEMAAIADGRLFIANRNDGTLTIVDLDPACEPYGDGCPGTGGIVPTLSCTGTPSPGQSFSLDLGDGLGGASAWLFGGTQAAESAMGAGCSLLVAPLAAPFGPLVLDGGGAVSVPVPVPAGTPLGTAATVQAFVIDGQGALGFSNTNALALKVE